MSLQPSIPDLAKFLNSFLNAKQMGELVGMLNRSDATALDPEAVSIKLNAGNVPVEKITAPAGIHELLKEMEVAYDIAKLPDPSAEESRRVRDAHPGFIERCSAYQGRHLVKMIRERLKSI